MLTSKEWNWRLVNESEWIEPSEESYYLLNRWKEKQFLRFLDLGCGKGRHSVFFANNGFDVTGIDLSEYAINGLNEQIKEKNLKIKTVIGNILELPFKDEEFDCLIAYHVISHTDICGIRVIIKEMNRVLKSGGEFFITLCSKKSPSFNNPNHKKIDANTIIKGEDGPEKGVPHYYSDDENIYDLFNENQIINLKLVNDRIFKGNRYDSWHYYILGNRK